MKFFKRILTLFLVVMILSTTAFANDDEDTTGGSGDVAAAVESTWSAANGQIKDVVRFRKINRVNAYNPKKLTKLKKQLKRAMLRSNPTYVATNTVKR